MPDFVLFFVLPPVGALAQGNLQEAGQRIAQNPALQAFQPNATPEQIANAALSFTPVGVAKIIPEAKAVIKLAEEARKIPTTRLSGFNNVPIEIPVASAVEATYGEKAVSSGFHGSLNNKWTIVYDGQVSPKLKLAAEQAGLEVTPRTTTANTLLTDVSLPNAKITDQKVAKEAFDNFAKNYTSELEGGVKNLPILKQTEVKTPPTTQEVPISTLPHDVKSLPNIIQQGVKPTASQDVLDTIREVLYSGDFKQAKQLHAEIAKDLKELEKKKEKGMFSPLSSRFGKKMYTVNQSGKMGVAVESLASTFLSIIQDKGMYLFKRDSDNNEIENPLIVKTGGKDMELVRLGRGGYRAGNIYK